MSHIIAIAATVALVAIWLLSTQRKLAALDRNINNAMLQIAVQLSSHWDAISVLLDLTKDCAAHEYGALCGTVKARRAITKSSLPTEIMAQEMIISETLGRIAAIAEGCREITSNPAYLQAMGAVNRYESMACTGRLIYNESVTRLNRAIRHFPTLLIAGLLDFRVREYLAATGEMVNISCLDMIQ